MSKERDRGGESNPPFFTLPDREINQEDDKVVTEGGDPKCLRKRGHSPPGTKDSHTG